MTDISIVSWNINSVRLRINRVVDFIQRESPDVVCLQEIKCQSAEFPEKAFRQAGFGHFAISGQKGMHGVAIASRLPLQQIETPDFCMREEARAVCANVAGFDIHNLYVPAGGDEPDPEINDKFAHKLDFLDRMDRIYTQRRNSGASPLIVVGDINVAPEENDVWSHKQLLKVVSHTPIETDKLKTILKNGGLNDLARSQHAPEEKLYTWWSYRSRDWTVSNRGRRLDHIWTDEAASPLADLPSYKIHLSDRGGEKPSDHAPVSIRLKRAN